MSVVVWDGKTIAADKQSTSGDLIRKCTKIRQLPNGDIVAWTGTTENGLAVAQWYEAGADPAAWPASQKGDDWSRLVVCSKGKVFTYEQLPIKQMVMDRFGAWGSGRDFALGAMAVGAPAALAVHIASKLASSCGGGVDFFRVK